MYLNTLLHTVSYGCIKSTETLAFFLSASIRRWMSPHSSDRNYPLTMEEVFVFILSYPIDGGAVHL